MCGDHGLPHELFRCNLCRLRLQHRYGSDLYPRVPGPYKISCNWCLTREEDGRGGGGSPMKAAVVGDKRRLKYSRDDREEMRPCSGGCTRSEFSADPEQCFK
ncbi:hypothetical protein HU200_062518 [Digitaria exilis]|uniref:PHD-type zinc finger plants domain-containing protein n=1 Tax=Digitaria exilis TaxID=1010633 RepID=A0A835AFC9_9POAL|nr:hypothetical protein HU200_062518 [Digitaria exilis]